MATKESLGLLGIESVHWYVHDLERSRRFYTQGMDFKEIGGSDPELTARGRQQSLVFQAGDIALIVSQPRGQGGATIMEDIQKVSDGKGGSLSWFSITTPFGDSTFRFAQRDGYRPLYPGMIFHEKPSGGQNRFGFNVVDHVTSNFRTLMPAILWMEQVMGLERFWKIEFHTDDAADKLEKGSGLRSTVMWDPESGVKFANNEPARPNFKASQINIFVEDNRGEGIQHLALGVENIIPAVEGMKKTGSIHFMDTPDTYYDQLPKRLEVFGIKRIDEKQEDLRRLRILIDGNKEHSYLLQIFMKDAATLYGERDAGPFFYEVIQRKGDKGFGAGNFRSLFESIERDQKAAGRV